MGEPSTDRSCADRLWKKSYPLPVNLRPQDLENRKHDSPPKSEEEPSQIGVGGCKDFEGDVAVE